MIYFTVLVFRRLLSSSDSPPIQEVLDLQVLPRIVSFLSEQFNDDPSELKSEIVHEAV